MLAAAPQESERQPALFHIALQILSADRVLPAQLATYVAEVISQAFDVAENPNAIRQETLPEAIRLALEIQASDALRTTIEQGRHTKLSPDIARKVLELEQGLETPR